MSSNPALLAPKTTLFVGIDPGVRGALVALGERGEFFAARPLPIVGPPKHRQLDAPAFGKMLDDLPTIRVGSGSNAIAAHVFIEELVAMPGRGAIGAMSSGVMFGAMLGVLQLRNLPVTMVRSQRWQKRIPGLPTKPSTKGLSPEARKRARDQQRKALKETLVLKARLACPELREEIDSLGPRADGFCDAYWIAEWGRATGGAV